MKNGLLFIQSMMRTTCFFFSPLLKKKQAQISLTKYYATHLRDSTRRSSKGITFPNQIP